MFVIFHLSEGRHAAQPDAILNMRGVLDAFIKWGTATAQGSDWLDRLSTTKQKLAARALIVDNIESLDGPFKAVSDAAKECGIGDHFSVSYKLLSKFAHPTAMRIIAQPHNPAVATLRDMFFSDGCLFFVGAFEAIEGQLRA